MRKLCLITLLLSLTTSMAAAFHAPGHDLIARSAVAALPKDSLPAFFAAGVESIAGASLDPDCFTRPIAPKLLHDTESPEHFADMELLADLGLPATRYEYLALVMARNIKPADAGMVHYAIAEWTARLAVALAEHRRWPDDPAVRAKCLVYAGILSHYAADGCQPLHTTIHYDGRVAFGKPSPRSGIHMKTDALPGKLSVTPQQAAAGLTPKPFDDALQAAWAQVRKSFGLVDRVYELEKDIPAYEAPLDAKGPVARFTLDLVRDAAQFNASLYLTAWQESAKIKLPDWHRRPPQSPVTQPDSAGD